MPDHKDPKKECSDKLSDVTLPKADGSEPEIYALKREGAGWRLSRRTFLSATAIAAGGAAACEKRKETIIVQTPGAGGQWVTSAIEPGAPIPAGGVCVCNTVPADPGLPNSPSVPTPPTPFPEPPAPGGPQRPKSSPKPTPPPAPCTCQGVCNCVGNCACQGVGHYWFPC